VTLVTSKLKRANQIRLLSIGFYAVTGALLMAFLSVTGFPPHVGFLGIVSLIAAYSVFMKRFWAPWLAFVLLFANTAFSAVTLYSVGFSNVLVSAALVPYLVLTWFVTIEQQRTKID
jgi:hypothetical protein